ncbi:MAG: tetratricopeptide repeat protein [Candidatus Aminicenantes bacterium]|jgi:tetratricopeptide (TPR) repeat protein
MNAKRSFKKAFILCVCLGLYVSLAVGFVSIHSLGQADRSRITKDYALAKKYYLEGLKHKKDGKLDKAQEKFVKSVEVSPNFPESFVELGNIYMRQKNFDRAIEEYDKAEESYLRLEAYVSKGIISTAAWKREFDVASRELYRDLQEPNFAIPPKVYFFKGGAYFRKGMLKEASEQFHRTIALDPNHGDAHNNLAVIYYLTKQYDIAWKHLRLAEENGAKVNPKFVEDLKKAAPEPKK